MTMTLVMPGDGQDLAELAQALISLADHPHDVVWSTRELGFEVPEKVAQAYAETVAGQLSTEETPTRHARAQARASRPAGARKAQPRRKKNGGAAQPEPVTPAGPVEPAVPQVEGGEA